jgi:hypothetical protein
MGKFLVRFGWGALLIGLLVLAVAGYWANRVQGFVTRAEVASGRVVDLERSYSHDSNGHESVVFHPVVSFQPVSGAERTFRGTTGTNPPAYDVGEVVEVLYDPARPADASIRATFEVWGGPIIVGGLGTVFALIGGGMLLGQRAAARRAEELRLHGTRVQATFQAVELNTSLRVNGSHPWRIACQWLDPTTGMVHLFRSANLWFDPAPYVHQKELTVFVDRRNPKRHLVDVSFLPKLAG